MSNLVSIELLKHQVRWDEFSNDEEYLQALLDAAVDSVIASTHRTEDELKNKYGAFPRQLVLASVMVAAHWYNQREAVTAVNMQAVPLAYDYLVKPFRKLEHPEDIKSNSES